MNHIFVPNLYQDWTEFGLKMALKYTKLLILNYKNNWHGSCIFLSAPLRAVTRSEKVIRWELWLERPSALLVKSHYVVP